MIDTTRIIKACLDAKMNDQDCHEVTKMCDEIDELIQALTNDLEETRRKLEPFKDLILIDPQPDWLFSPYSIDDIANNTKNWTCIHLERVIETLAAPSPDHHPIKIKGQWFWTT